MPQTDSAITPNRVTRLELDPDEYCQIRPSWIYRRTASRISRASTPRTGRTTGVQLQPSDAWTLAPLGMDFPQVVTRGNSPDAIPATDVELADGWTTVGVNRNNSDLPGMEVSGGLAPTGSVSGFTKRVGATATTWKQHLTADANALPGPDLTRGGLRPTHIPMDRAASGRVTYPANTGFLLAFLTAGDLTGYDNLLNFYFGGPTDVLPDTATGGHFCLSLHGDGMATLWEYDGTGAWDYRMEFAWSSPGQADRQRFHHIAIWPHGREDITFATATAPGIAQVSGFGAPILAQGKPQISRTYYRNEPAQSGHRKLSFATGPGTIRWDMRRDWRTVLLIYRLRPPASGQINDLPVYIPHSIPFSTPVRVSVDAYLPPGTSIEYELRDAESGLPLSRNAAGDWLTLSNKQTYFVRVELKADANRTQTPVLHAYELEMGGASIEVSGTDVSLPVQRVSITGPDLDPQQDTASVQIEDPTNSASLLRTRARIRAKLVANSDAGALRSVLFEGEVARADANKKGKPGNTYPSPNWHAYDVTLVGMWARLADAMTMNVEYFNVDKTAPAGPYWNGSPPWKVTAIISYLLKKCGFAADQVNIPDLPLRLFATSARSVEDYQLMPGTSPAEFIQKLARDYLGMVLCWDPNSGTRGQWRLLANPASPYNNLASFVTAPTGAGKLAMHPNSYTGAQCPIIGETWHTWVKPPEGNLVIVVGAGGLLPDAAGPLGIWAAMKNPASYNFFPPIATADKSNADYLGRVVPIVHHDPTLETPEACAWVCRRIYEFAAHAQKWAAFQAPLILVTDSTDSAQTRGRPLRVNDAVTVKGEQAIIRSCNPLYDYDVAQLANYEVLFVS